MATRFSRNAVLLGRFYSVALSKRPLWLEKDSKYTSRILRSNSFQQAFWTLILANYFKHFGQFIILAIISADSLAWKRSLRAGGHFLFIFFQKLKSSFIISYRWVKTRKKTNANHFNTIYLSTIDGEFTVSLYQHIALSRWLCVRACVSANIVRVLVLLFGVETHSSNNCTNRKMNNIRHVRKLLDPVQPSWSMHESFGIYWLIHHFISVYILHHIHSSWLQTCFYQIFYTFLLLI